MSLYALQKLIRNFNRDPALRAAFAAEPQAVLSKADLSPHERDAMANRDYGALYGMGVHGLLLRPFSILHGVGERDYLDAIRGEG